MMKCGNCVYFTMHTKRCELLAKNVTARNFCDQHESKDVPTGMKEGDYETD